MKTSVIEVRDMLSVLSVLGVEKRIGEVPGVESVTVNYAAGSATVRYDETRLKVGDIKSDVRQSAYEAAAHAAASAGDGHVSHKSPGAAPPATAAPATPKSDRTPLPPRSRPLLPQSPARRLKLRRLRRLIPQCRKLHRSNRRPCLHRLLLAPAIRVMPRRAHHPQCPRIWRMRWAMAAKTCRPWYTTCETASGFA